MPFEAPTRLRCHTGHTFTADVSAQAQAEKMEEVMWVAMRTLRERAQMLRRLADRASGARERRDWTERADEADDMLTPWPNPCCRVAPAANRDRQTGLAFFSLPLLRDTMQFWRPS